MRSYFFRRCVQMCCGIILLLGVVYIGPMHASHDVPDMSIETEHVCTTCVYAQATRTIDITDDNLVSSASENQSVLDTIQSMEWLMKGLYLLLWPLLAIAGAALDNSLVYGEIFFLDTMLWKFWQIMRNFVNFGIGLMFVGSILLSFFYQNKEKFSLPTILKNTFIAGFLVQMSRFIVAVLIDLSTVGVVGLGAMPLTILEQSDDHVLSEIRFLKPHTIFNLDGTKEAERDYAEHAIVYSCPDGDQDLGKNTYYAACRVDQGNFIGETPIDGPIEPKSREAYVNSIETVRTNAKVKNIEINDDYCVRGMDLLKQDFGAEASPENIFAMRKAGRTQMKRCNKMDEYVTKAQGMTGPLYLLFAVVLDMGEIAVTSNTLSTTEVLFHSLIKLLIGVALMIPLAVMAVILIIRSVILWLVIAFSPLLVLIFVYGYGKDSESAKIGGGNLTKLSDVLTLIFFPVFVVFAISLSLVFLTLISRSDFIQDTTTCEEDALSLMGCDITDCGDTEITYDCFGAKFTMTREESTMGANVINTMGWLVKNVLGIALMWAIIFFALKTNRMTRGLVKGIEGLGKSLAMSVPIVPTNNGWMQVGALGKTMDKVSNLPKDISDIQYQNSPVKGWLDDMQQGLRGDTNALDKEMGEAKTVTEANKVMKKVGAANSNLRDYDNSANMIGAGGGHTAGTFSDHREALADKKSIENIVQNIGFTQFFDNFFTDKDNRSKLKELYKDLAAAEKGLERAGADRHEPIEGKRVYTLDKDNKKYVIEFDVDQQGNLTGSSDKQLTQTGIKTKKDIEVVSELMKTYGSTDELDKIIGKEYTEKFVDQVIKNEKHTPDFEYNIDVGGEHDLVYTATTATDEGGNKKVTSFSVVSGGKDDAKKS